MIRKLEKRFVRFGSARRLTRGQPFGNRAEVGIKLYVEE